MSELLYSLPTWDLHNLGSLFKPDFNFDACGFINGSPEEAFQSPEMEYSDVSTGYLEDALMEFGERSKRRRLLFDDKLKSFDINEIYMQKQCVMPENYNSTVSPHVSSDNKSGLISNPISTVHESPDTSATSDKIYVREKSPICPKTPTEPYSSSYGINKNKRPVTKLVYPFGLVKPGAREEDLTLNDINKKILMPPARPVRHPVGDFAGRPGVSARGPGLSGKAVVALTRIQTQGKGTITIIRTKG